MERNIIYTGDCIKVLSKKIASDSVNLIFADPPYNLSGKSLSLAKNTTGGPFYKVNEKWDTWEIDEYLRFTNDWLAQSWRVLKSGGSIFISCTQHNIGEVVFLAKKKGFKLNNIITWYKTNAMPNITKRTFTHSTEYVCWFVKGKNWKFNYKQVKELNPRLTREGVKRQMRDFLDFIELPVLQGPERLKNKNGRALHPTQKPEKLLEIIITACSDPGDLVLDPFFGTGTTGVVAKRLGREWIGIELDKNYVESARDRIQRTAVRLI